MIKLDRRVPHGVEPSSLGLGAAEYSSKNHDKETGRTAYKLLYVPRWSSCSVCVRKWGVVVNGMSLYARDSGVANSAIVG